MLPVYPLNQNSVRINPAETNYPKSLTILINTRIRGYSKIKYEPKMSIPGIRSDTVYFDPLIKLNASTSSKLPQGYPPSELYTQFFVRGEFDSLLARTINSAYFGERKKTLKQATEDGYVDNNINITLRQLFKPGSVFYLNGQPFTINGFNWDYGDWQIGTKSILKNFEMNTDSYGQSVRSLVQNQISSVEEAAANQELQEFEKLHSGVMRGKINPKYSKFNDNGGLLSDQGRGVKGPGSSSGPGFGKTLSALAKPLIPAAISQFFNTQLVFDSVVNEDPNKNNLASDPVSKTILDSLNKIYQEEKDKNPALRELNKQFTAALQDYIAVSKEFKMASGTSVGSDDESGTITAEKIILRQDLIDNRNKIMDSIKSMPFTASSADLDKLTNMVKDASGSTATALSKYEKITLDEFTKLLDDFSREIKQASSAFKNSIVASSKKDAPTILKTFSGIFAALEALEALPSITEITTFFDKQNIADLLKQSEKIEYQQKIQQIRGLYQQYYQLCKQFIETYKAENFDYISTPIVENDSIMTLKGKYEKLIATFKKGAEKYKHDGFNTAEGIIGNSTIKDRLFDLTNEICKTRNAFLMRYKSAFTLFLKKREKQLRYISVFCTYLRALRDIQVKKKDLMYKKEQRAGNDMYNSVELIKMDISVWLLQLDYASYSKILDQGNIGSITANTNQIIDIISKLTPDMYNTREEFIKYYDLPELLDIDKYQLDNYIFNLFVYDFDNEQKIWEIISNQTTLEFNSIKETFIESIGKTYILHKKYNDTYDENTRATFLANFQKNEVPLQQTNSSSFFLSTTDQYKQQRKEFMYLRNAQVISYTYITLYSRLSVITLARQITWYSQDQLHNSSKREVAIFYGRYLNAIKKKYALIYNKLPGSIFWDIADLNTESSIDAAIFDNEDEINECIRHNTELEDSIKDLEVQFKNESEMLIPYISKMSILKKCNELTNPENIFARQNVVSTSEKIKEDFLKNFIKIDESLFEINNDLQLLDNQYQQIFKKRVSNDWGIYYYEYNKRQLTIIEAFVTALNGQLVVTNKTTSNKYAIRDPFFGDKFTVETIREALYDALQPENSKRYDIDYYLDYYYESAVQFCEVYINNVIEIKRGLKLDRRDRGYSSRSFTASLNKQWASFGFMFRQDLDKTYKIMESNEGKKDKIDYKKIIYDRNQIAELIRTSELYRGDNVILSLLEKIFKIKSVVIDSKQNGINVGSYVNFVLPRVNLSGYVKEIKDNETKNPININYDVDIKTQFKNKINKENDVLYLNFLKETFLTRIVKLKNWPKDGTKRPKDFKVTWDQYTKLIKVIDYILKIIEIINLPISNTIFPDPQGDLPEDIRNKMDATGETYLRSDRKTITSYKEMYSRLIRTVKLFVNNSTSLDLTAYLEFQEKSKYSTDLTSLYVSFDVFIRTFNVQFPSIVVVDAISNNTFEISILAINDDNFKRDVDRVTFSLMTNPPDFSLPNFQKMDDYLFLFKNNIDYFNFYNTDDKFIYNSSAPNPDFFDMLVFNTYVRFTNAEIKNIPFFSNLSDKMITKFDEYRKKYTAWSTSIGVGKAETDTGLPDDIEDSLRRAIRVRPTTKPGFASKGGAAPLVSHSYVSSNRGNSAIASNSESRLSYYVIIDLDLYPGKDGIPLSQKLVLNCQNRYEKIKQAWAKLFGLVYRPTEIFIPGYKPPPSTAINKSRQNRGTRKRDNRNGDERKRDKRNRNRDTQRIRRR